MNFKVKHIDIVDSSSGDWQGLYLDGTLATQGHMISLQDLVRYLKSGYETVAYHEAYIWLEEEGSLPGTMEECIEKGLYRAD